MIFAGKLHIDCLSADFSLLKSACRKRHFDNRKIHNDNACIMKTSYPHTINVHISNNMSSEYEQHYSHQSHTYATQIIHLAI